jgi:hypothetical protein
MKNLPVPQPKKPSAFAYSMQQLWMPNTFVIEKNDEVFARNYWFTNVYNAASGVMNAVHVSDMVIKKYINSSEN